MGNQEASAHLLEVPDSRFAVDIILKYLQYRLLALGHYDHGTAREVEAGRLVILGHILQDGAWWQQDRRLVIISHQRVKRNPVSSMRRKGLSRTYHPSSSHQNQPRRPGQQSAF